MFNNYGYNPYFSNQKFPQMEQLTTPNYNQQYQQPMQMQKISGLLGKSVDNIDVVKAMDIPLDGSVSYFPLTDGSAIVSKQLQSDGTSKIVVYKPTNEEKKEQIKYATIEDIQNAINEIDFNDIQEIQDIIDEFKELKKEIKDLKGKIKAKGE